MEGKKETKKIWFRAGYEAEVTPEELEILKATNNYEKAAALMEEIVSRAELRGETYILGKSNGGCLDEYDNPDDEISFLF